MRVSCLCTDADYECDVNYVKNLGGGCDPLPEIKDEGGPFGATGVDKDLDCQAEGFYYVSQGYRKIPGDKCYGGVQKDPSRKPCNGMAFISSTISLKTVVIGGILVAIFYYGWPIIEAVLLMLPIPDPKEQIEKVKSFAGAAGGALQGVMSTPSRRPDGNAGYSGNLEAAPGAYLEGDDSSDEDLKAAAPAEKLNYDSDPEEKADDESVPVTAESPSSELIDLGGSTSESSGPAKKIPKLAGPK